MENFDRIQNYLLGNMSPAERLSFEKEVVQNEQLAEELEVQRFELETLDQLEEDSLRAKAKELSTKKATASSKEANVHTMGTKKTKKPRWFLLAAAASVLLLIGFFLYNNTSSSTADILSYGYGNGNIEFKRTKRGAPNTDEQFDQKVLDILINQNQSKAEEAIQYFSSISPTSPTTQDEAKINLAHSYILNKEFHKAIDILNIIETSTNIDDRKKEEVLFTKALANIGAENETEATSILNQIVDKNGRFKPRAVTILEMLD